MKTESTTNRPDRAYLRQLLSERNQHPERAAMIDAEIRRAFEQKVAILILDMCGFSRLTAKYGIMHFLGMIHQMDEAARPAIAGNGGKVIKQEADNLFAVFDHPAQALEAALDIFRAFDAMNAVLPEERDIYGAVGIGYGETLVIGNEDLFGAEMNLACKLGEDCAGRSEILLTSAARQALPFDQYQCTQDAFVIGDARFECYRFDKKVFES